MYLLDTNVVSELRRRKPHGAVLAWLRTIPESTMHISAITLGELQAGVEKTRQIDQAKASEIEEWMDELAARMKVLPADGPIFRRWAQLMHGQPDELIEDAIIAATAELHGFIVITRNVRDFETLGAKTFNPFNYRSE
jgi:predicted nucleic acid-binding protein